MNTCRDSKSMLSRNDNHVVGRGTGKLVNDTAGRAKHGHTMLQTARKEVKKTHYPYKEPRIDQKMYQAEIPPLQGRNSSRASTRGSSPRAAPDLRPGQLSLTENRIWSPALVQDDREQSSGEAVAGYDLDTFQWRTGGQNGLVPNESDEVALEFLHKHACNVSRAEFHVATQVSSGAGVRSLEVSEAKRGPPQQLLSWQSAYSKRLDALGLFESADFGGYVYPSELVRRSMDPSSEEDEPPWDPEREEDEADDEELDDVAAEIEDESAEIPSAVLQGQDLERSRRGADRAAFKSRWNALQERVRDIRHSRKREKPTLADCVGILDEAASLPPPEQAPGEDFVEQAQQAVSTIWDMTVRAREWVATVSDVLHPGSDPRRLDEGRCGVGVTELQKLLSESHSLPVTVAEADELSRIIDAALDWQRKADETLSALQAPVKAKIGRNSGTIQLTRLKDMLDEAQLIPVRLEQRNELKRRLQSATQLAANIAEAFPSGRRIKTRPSLATAQDLTEKVKSSGLEFPASFTLKKYLTAVNEWLNRAKAALAGSVPLRDLEKLLAEADKLAVDPGPKLPELQAKMDKALAWLEKVRKAVPKQRSTRRNAPDAEAEKVDLNHVKGLLNASSTTGVEMDMKEFSHTNDLIENAEEWMARVREVLESGEPATLHSLEALLSEAETIPVTMDEQQLLTAGIKARQWRLRVDAMLNSGKAKVHELQELASKGATLRAGFPKDAKNHRVYGVLDESELQALLKRGKAWGAKARQSLQTMQAGRPLETSVLSDLLAEATTIKLDLSPEIISLRKVDTELNQWRIDHEEILRCLGLTDGLPGAEVAIEESRTDTSVDTTSNLSGKEPTVVSSPRSCKRNDSKPAVTSVDMDETQSFEERTSIDLSAASTNNTKAVKMVSKITVQNLSACIHAAEKITIGRSMKEVRDMRSLLQSVNDWVEQCQSLCPRRQSKRRVQPTNKPTFKRLEDFMAEGLTFPVAVTEEVARIRKHIAEAASWQLNAQSVLERVASAFAEQTLERMELWRKEDADDGCDIPDVGRDGVNRDSLRTGTIPSGEESGEAPQLEKNTSNVTSDKPTLGSKCVPVRDKSRQDDPTEDQGSDALDREDELDEAEESNEVELRQLLTTARDISVFMPEEMVTERMQRIMEWARSVRESASYAGEGLQLSQAKDIVKVAKGVLDLKGGNGMEIAALTPSIVKSLQLVIECYKAKVEAIQKKLKKAEGWMVQAKELMAKDSMKIEEIEGVLKAAREVGVENEDLAKKIRGELGRCRAWLGKADAALQGDSKLSASAVKKLIAEGEKIKTSGSKLKDLKQHMKAATKWLQRLKRTGIEKGTASISELKSLIPEAAAIRVDLSDDVRVLKQATCSYCICSRPGEDLGFLVECQTCTEGYHGVCMGISQEQADVMRKSEEGFKCLRCRINNLFTSAEQAMLGAMKKWMPSTCFAEQAGFDKTPSTDDSGISGRDRWQSSQNFAALAGVVRDAMNLPRKKIRTSLGVLSEVDNNINALTTLPWGKNAAGEEQHEYARAMLCSLRVLLWCTMAQWAVRKPPSVVLLYDLVSQGQQLSQVDHDLLETLGTMARRASLWEASVRDAFRAPSDESSSPIDVATLRNLLTEAKQIPVLLSLEPKVVAALEDEGNRYCLCRGPNDGSFMVGCDTCEEWFHGACVKIKEGEGKNLTNFECPGCAERRGVPYVHGKVNLKELRDRAAAAAAPVVEVIPQGDEESSGSDVTSKTCTWPPPEAEYFFGTLDLTQLAGTDPGPPVPEHEAQAGVMHPTEAYQYQDMSHMAGVAPHPTDAEGQHVAPQFHGQQYLPPTAAGAVVATQYGGVTYQYQHYPHGPSVDPFNPHATDHFGGVRPAAPQGHPADPYTLPVPPNPTEDPAALGDVSRKRVAEESIATTGPPKRGKPDDPPAGQAN